MKTNFPSSFASINTWADENNVTMTEARVRLAQYAVLLAAASSRALSTILVLKGGNALDFVWQPNRSTRDLDFSIDLPGSDTPPNTDLLRELFTPALNISGRTLGITLGIHRIEQQPPGPNRTFITYEMHIGYALPDDTRLRKRMENGLLSTKKIKVEMSVHELVCADEPINVEGTHKLRVSTIEDIVAEKLRALLQQPIRNRYRRQDLLDIAITFQLRSNLDKALVADFLLRKAQIRDVTVSRAAFHHPDVIDRARQGYEELRSTTRYAFIPFELALQALYELVNALNIPDR